MVWFRRLFDFYINSSLHVALAVLSLLNLAAAALALPIDFDLRAFVFFGTITGYNFVKYAGVAQLHHRSLTQSLRVIQVFSLLCFAFLLYHLLQMPPHFLLFCLPLCLLTLFYAVPLFPRKQNLRSVPFIKVFVIAMVWAGVTVYIPLVYAEKTLPLKSLALMLVHFLFTLALIIPFEIRDLKFDPQRLRTIPQILGIRKTKNLGYLLLAVIAILVSVLFGFTEFFWTYILMALFTAISIHMATVEKSRWFTAFVVEGIPILGWLFLKVLFQ